MSRCAVCGSHYHWVRDCPDKDEQVPVKKQKKRENPSWKRTEEAFEATTEADDDAKEESLITVALAANISLLEECWNHGILDSACTKSIAGVIWYENFTATLPDDLEIKTTKSNAQIMFGNSGRQSALFRAILPIEIAGVKCTLEADIIDGNLPLLISKEAMKRGKMTMNFDQGKAFFQGRQLNLSLTSSGHYKVPILRSNGSKTSSLALITGNSSKLQFLTQKQLHKLHRQFGHCTVEALKKLLSKAQIEYDNVILEKIVKSCQTCLENGRESRKPHVSLPLSNSFNQVLAMDLTETDKKETILHVICTFSRYSIAIAISDKQAETILEALLNNRIMIFGAPDTAILTDNGREFNNQHFRDLCEKFNFSTFTTAAYSPFSNGICERANAVLKEILRKVRSDHPNSPLQVCLSYACAARNNLYNYFGFTPSQIALGKNPKLPSVENSALPALELPSVSKVVTANLQLLESSRNAFIQAESSNRVKRALNTTCLA